MRALTATIIGLFTAAMLLVLLPFAAVSKDAAKAVRVVFALVAAVVLVDELRELFGSKPVVKALAATSEEPQTTTAKALQMALAAGGRVS